MQTFLPYSSFIRTARCLDRQRLGKQRVECLQILKALSGESKGWKTHPAVLMWKGHERFLIKYGEVICKEWISRGYNDNTLQKIVEYNEVFGGPTIRPPWLGNQRFHLGHKSNLVRKRPDLYGIIWPEVDSDLPYVWPVEETL